MAARVIYHSLRLAPGSHPNPASPSPHWQNPKRPPTGSGSGGLGGGRCRPRERDRWRGSGRGRRRRGRRRRSRRGGDGGGRNAGGGGGQRRWWRRQGEDAVGRGHGAALQHEGEREFPRVFLCPTCMLLSKGCLLGGKAYEPWRACSVCRILFCFFQRLQRRQLSLHVLRWSRRQQKAEDSWFIRQSWFMTWSRCRCLPWMPGLVE